MILGCIDIGSNTTRLLVAEAEDGRLRPLTAERVFTCIRRSLAPGGHIPADKIAETVAVVREQVATARELGAEQIVAVATAVIRDAANRAELERALDPVLGMPLRVISGEEEARLSFAGATRTLAEPVAGRVAVVDVGGASTEVAVGAPSGPVEWWRSLAIGSGILADRFLPSDPPSAREIESGRKEAVTAFSGLGAPAVDATVAVGGTAMSLLGVLGAALDHGALERALAMLTQGTAAELVDRLALDPERLRVLPAGVLILQAAADRLGPLRIARGGLREGVLLELVAQDTY